MLQFYRLARSKALQSVFPDFVVDDETDIYRAKNFRYPRPYSEPPSPNSSRPTTPGTSVRGSDDEEDEVDEENEVRIRPQVTRKSAREYLCIFFSCYSLPNCR